MMNPLFTKLLVDVVCLVLFSIPLLVFKFVDVPLTRRGFFCNDNSLRYPYHGSTIPSTLNIALAFITMFLLCFLTEFLINKINEKKSKTGLSNPVMIEVYRAFGYFMIGAAINQIFTDMLKLSVGRLRPHFYEVCQPSVACTEYNQHDYIFNFTCTRVQHPLISDQDFKKKLREVGKSFPSGHSSLAVYASVFIGIYLEYRFRKLNMRLIRHLLQVSVMCWSLWVCCTRVFDNKHHPTDVLFGAMLGALVAALTGYLYITSHLSSNHSTTLAAKSNSFIQEDVVQSDDRDKTRNENNDAQLLKTE